MYQCLLFLTLSHIHMLSDASAADNFCNFYKQFLSLSLCFQLYSIVINSFIEISHTFIRMLPKTSALDLLYLGNCHIFTYMISQSSAADLMYMYVGKNLNHILQLGERICIIYLFRFIYFSLYTHTLTSNSASILIHI